MTIKIWMIFLMMTMLMERRLLKARTIKTTINPKITMLLLLEGMQLKISLITKGSIITMIQGRSILILTMEHILNLRICARDCKPYRGREKCRIRLKFKSCNSKLLIQKMLFRKKKRTS